MARNFMRCGIEPYLLFTAGRHADLAPRIQAIADGIEKARIALMQGDISPKNILVGPQGPVFLDAETACYGDPAFDAAFCLNHLLLKCVWHPEFMAAYLESFRAWKSAYLKGAGWEDPHSLEARIAAILGVFLLARVDGKSPVEYLTAASDKEFVRGTAQRLHRARRRPAWMRWRDEWGEKLAAQPNRSVGHRTGTPGSILGGMNHQRAFHAGDILLGRQRIGDEGWKPTDRWRHAFEQEIHFARQHVAFAHFRPGAHPLLEMLEIGVLLAGQADKDKAGDLKSPAPCRSGRRDSPRR